MTAAEITIASILCAGIAALWKYVLTNIRDSIRELKHRSEICEQDRVRIHQQLEDYGTALAVFKSCAANPCPAKEGLRRMETFSLIPTEKIQ